MNPKIRAAAVIFLAFFASSAFAQSQSPQDADQQIMDFSLSGFGDRGKKNWDLSGKSADIVTDDVKLNDVVGNMYGDKENIKLTADKGNFNKADGKVHLEKNVLITTSGGAKLTTDSLNWDRKNQLVSTSDKVNIERDNMIAQALGAVGHPNLNKVSLEKDVEVKINPVAEDKLNKAGVNRKIVITCDGPMEIDYQRNIATFNKTVKVDTEDATIYSDVMEVYFTKSAEKPDKPKSSAAAAMGMGTQVDKIKAFGNVTIIRGDNVSQSDEAVYTASDGKITLSGKPKLVIYSGQGKEQHF
ncbi:MAG: LPS export ABC transporter periplasmic protein LptC [Candidatus Omnitrophica bacterium]|nr:LPS export ABC transporter periplasmic protein LptC [Candidatus Omnitrophota bacterium]